MWNLIFVLLISFLQIGLFSVGGGYATIPLIQEQVVNIHKWLTFQEFTDIITISQMTPGPLAVNTSTFVGIRIAGLSGAVIATIGCILPSCFIVSFLAFIYYHYKGVAVLQSVLESLRPAVVALIASAGLSVLAQVTFQGKTMIISNINYTGVVIFCVAFLILRRLKQNPIAVMAACGMASFILKAITGV